jgi:hypothetical protein
MRRVFRWLFDWIAVLSLLLCAATFFFWFRGLEINDSCYWVAPARSFQMSVDSGNGKIALGFVDVASGTEHLGSAPGFHYERSKPVNLYSLGWPIDFNWQGLGFLVRSFRSLLTSPSGKPWVTRWSFVAFPCWFVLTLLAILPTVWVIRYRRTVQGHGLCPTCGYDLRATPDRCPECGRVPKSNPAATL